MKVRIGNDVCVNSIHYPTSALFAVGVMAAAIASEKGLIDRGGVNPMLTLIDTLINDGEIELAGSIPLGFGEREEGPEFSPSNDAGDIQWWNAEAERDFVEERTGQHPLWSSIAEELQG